MLDGVTKWEPIGRRSRGAGATFAVEMSALGLHLGDRLKLDKWDPPRSIGWHSVGGVMSQRGLWHFTSYRGGTGVELRITYDPPAGILGNAVAGPVEGLVKRRLHKALGKMKRLIESQDGVQAS